MIRRSPGRHRSLSLNFQKTGAQQEIRTDASAFGPIETFITSMLIVGSWRNRDL
jgi:hypothetical protein